MIDLFGEEYSEDLHYCKSCKKHLPESNFYPVSSSKKTVFNRVRDQCKPCWNRLNGKYKNSSSEFNNPEHVSVIEKIKDKFIFGGIISYDESRKKLLMETLPNVDSVYCIVDTKEEKIHKIGKASGEQGLSKRARSYTVEEFAHERLLNELKNTKLSIFYFPVEPKFFIDDFGHKLKYQAARDLEKILSKQARKENHPMLLSKID